MEKSKVFLSDPQVLFREGIHFILSGEDDFEVIGETTNNEDAFTHITANPPNIAVLSMHNGKFDGPEITCRIKRSLPSVAIILIMETANNDLLFAAMKSGASACLTKNSDPEYLLDIIRVVSQGSLPILESLFIPEIASKILADFEQMNLLGSQLEDLLATLAPQETQILASIANGNAIEQVAAELDSTEENVRRNLRLILNKLVANDQSRILFDAAQRNMPVLMQNMSRNQAAAADYVTREEFNEFKESFMERLKSLIGELT